MKKHPDCEDRCQLLEHKGYRDCYMTGLCARATDADDYEPEDGAMAISNKRPVAWHEICLNNMRSHYQSELRLAIAQQERAYRLSRAISHYEAQIAEAKRRGVDGFDSERFMKAKP